MAKSKFIKEPFGHQALIKLMKDRGLEIDDDKIAYDALSRIGYYRLSGYCLPFKDKKTNAFYKGTNFRDVTELYSFDTELRSLVAQSLEKLEVAIRCSICEYMSSSYGSHWYTDPNAYQAGKYAAIIEEAANKLDFDLAKNQPFYQSPSATIQKTRQLFLDHYYDKYDIPAMPPAWMLRELSTFGFWARVFEALKIPDQKQVTQLWMHPDKKRIDHELLSSWFWSISILRNRCSHHTRITNQNFSFPPKLPQKNPSKGLFYSKTDDLHTLLTIILILLNCSSPSFDFRKRLLDLFNTFKTVNIEKATGFSLEGKSMWEETNFWTFVLN